MRNILFVLIILFTVCISVKGQGKAQEKDIKVSGNYYYGEAISSSFEEAYEIAVKDLKLMISEKTMQERTTVSEVDFKGFENDIATVSIELEGRVKVIAFINKKEVVFDPISEKKVFIIRKSSVGPEVIAEKIQEKPQAAVFEIGKSGVTPMSEAHEEKPQPKVIDLTPNTLPKQKEQSTKQIINVENNNASSHDFEIVDNTPKYEVEKIDTPQIQNDNIDVQAYNPEYSAEPRSKSEQQTESHSTSEYQANAPSTSIYQADVSSTNENSAVNFTVNKPQNINVDSNVHPIIRELLNVSSYEEARKILNTNKYSGKLMFGQIATLTKSSECYFLLIKSGKVTDILDKASGSERKGLMSGETLDYRMVTETVIWIYIL